MERVKASVRSVREANEALRLLLAELECPPPGADFSLLIRRVAAIVFDMNGPLLRNPHETARPSTGEAAPDDLAVYGVLLRRVQSALTGLEKSMCEKRTRILAERAALERAGQWTAAQIGDR